MPDRFPLTALAQWLGVSPEVLSRLRLCRTPKNRGEVERIAAELGGDVGRMCAVMGW